MPTFTLYGDNRFGWHVVDLSLADQQKVSRQYGSSSDRIVAQSPEEAMKAWSVHLNNSLVQVAPGVWKAQYDLMTQAHRNHIVKQEQRAAKKLAKEKKIREGKTIHPDFQARLDRLLPENKRCQCGQIIQDNYQYCGNCGRSCG